MHKARDGDPLLLPTRELARVFVRLLGNPHPLEIVHRRRLGVLLRHAADPDRGEGQVLEHAQVREQVEVLKHHPDLAADRLDVLDVVVQLDAVDEDMALLVLLEPVDAADHCRLAGPRRPADHDLLALLDLQVDVPQHVELAEPLVDVAEDDAGDAVRSRVGSHDGFNLG
jgi:hypothetical protein